MNKHIKNGFLFGTFAILTGVFFIYAFFLPSSPRTTTTGMCDLNISPALFPYRTYNYKANHSYFDSFYTLKSNPIKYTIEVAMLFILLFVVGYNIEK